MNSVSLLALITGVVQLGFAGLLFGLSRGPGWRPLSSLGGAALTGGLYSLCALGYTLDGLAEPTRLWTARGGLVFGGLHAACLWLFTAADEGRRLDRLERVLFAVGMVFIVLSAVPGALSEPVLLVRELSWPRVLSYDSPPTALGGVSFLFVLVALGVLVHRNVVSARRGARGAKARVVMISLLWLAMVHDTLGAAGYLQTPYVLDVVFLAGVGVFGVQLTRRFVESAHTLDRSLRRLEAMQAELVRTERLAALGELSAVVAHEVRNPLAVLFNATARLERLVAGDAPEARQLLSMVSEECERLDRMVADLLHFARPLEPRRQRVPIAELVRGAVEAARLYTRAPEAQVRLALPPDLPPVEVDPQLLRQAVLNLVTNGLQVSTGRRPLEVRLGQDDGALTIEVVDDGPGIPAELKERIFTPFFTTRAQGTGLGLAVVRKVMESHGGQVLVAEAPEFGTVFSLRLPA